MATGVPGKHCYRFLLFRQFGNLKKWCNTEGWSKDSFLNERAVKEILHVGVTVLQIEHITLGKMERHLRDRDIVAGSGPRPTTRWAPRASAPRRRSRAGTAGTSAHRAPGPLPSGRGRNPRTLLISAQLPRPFNTALFAAGGPAPPGSSPVCCRLIRAFAAATSSWTLRPSSSSGKATSGRAVGTSAAGTPGVAKRIPGSCKIIGASSSSPSPGLVVLGAGVSRRRYIQRLWKQTQSTLGWRASVGKDLAVESSACGQALLRGWGPATGTSRSGPLVR